MLESCELNESRLIFRWARLAVCVLLPGVLIFSGCQTADRDLPPRSADVDPRLTGVGVVTVFMPDDWPAQLSEEDLVVYVGWAGLLEEFVSRSGNLREIRKADFRRADEVFRADGLPVNEYSLLISRNESEALFSNVPIFDGAVYDFADAWMGGIEREFFWPEILRMGQFERGMPREFKLVRMRVGRPMPVVADEFPADMRARPVGGESPRVLPGSPAPRPPVPPEEWQVELIPGVGGEEESGDSSR